MTDETAFQMSDSLIEQYEKSATGSPEVDDYSYILLIEDGEETKVDDSNKRDYILDLFERAKAMAKEEDPENFIDREMTDEEIDGFAINSMLSSFIKDGKDATMEFDQPAYMAACRAFHKEVKDSRNQLRDELFAHYGLDTEDDDADLLWDEAFQVAPGKFEVVAEAFGKMLADTEMQRGDFETPVVEEEVEEEKEPEETTEE